ncbi:hypothetical protein BOW53_08995 [Solemya pervernicosa gill symbiont]|uniref:HTH arsR-type domain-containing protein n=2 Tax=Gammaproteobacteria incertae sedis TaxID=118884 RepID=A0A1T2L4U3_9GAMM|nr:metalloregulator ArsR/SmtB family transcription factor [Candidatus Reidiella endopervernicosa]OOZ40081.1 hypothetical protein BOW53_08995 [Solemya pervernicosa gill symbiont]QKQ25393.1 helix-turn-helix transcriptional regulator [Candidatus Reidiella endopervernicosa]
MSNYQNDNLVQMAEQFKALANPHRLQIFLSLSTCCAPGTVCSSEEAVRSVGVIGEGLDIAPSTLSHHIKELNRAGLIEMERQGKQVNCWVDPATLEQLSHFFKS